MPTNKTKLPREDKAVTSKKANRQHEGDGDSRTWWLIDATSMPLGRVATTVAKLLIGKHKPSYVPYIDGGDTVVVINACDTVLTGNKVLQKTYYHHTRYPGGLRAETAKERMRAAEHHQMVQEAVRGMLPKNQLGPLMLKRLHVYQGAEHPHTQTELRPVEKE